MKKNLVWEVYNHDFNRDEFYKYNIFEHRSFREYVDKIFKEFKKSEDMEAFAEKIKRELQYYFWSRTEYEVVITKKDDRIIMTPLIGRKEKLELDVTYDKDFDWLGFYDKMIEKYINKNNGVKIDVYDQVIYYFDDFVDYCWNNR